MERRQFVLCGSVLASLPLLGCGDDEGGSSGSNNSGGTASGSGGENGSTGGSTNGSTGGSTNGSTGGSTSSGGGNMGGSGGGGGDDDACTGDLAGVCEEDGLGDHTHAYVLTLAEIMSAGPVNLVLEEGTGMFDDHPHTVVLTNGDLANLRNGETVQKRSDGDIHQHDVILSCVGM